MVQPAAPVADASFELTPHRGETGGERRVVSVTGGVTDTTITSIPCAGAAGTLYRVGATSSHYRPYVFVQSIRENRNNPASDDVEFWVRPGHVRDIAGPG